jgi:hypothetical protein
MQKVFHSSHHSGLKEIVPNISTHGENWVYATKELPYSALFLATLGGDLTCQIGSEDHIPTVTERCAGAFKERYAEKSGSIYILSGLDFHAEETGWSQEVIAEKSQDVLEEIVVENVMDFLINLEKNGALRILYYPNRPSRIPMDDEDLVDKCVLFTKDFGESYLEEVERFHPQLLERVKRKL